MTDVAERRTHAVVLADESGDERVVLVRCPACGAPLSPDQWPPGSSERARAEAVEEHLRARHFPEDFGLGRDARDYQAKLPGGEPA